MKKLYTLVSVLFLFFITNNSTAQVSTNGGSGLLASYGSLSGAIADLNAATISSNVVITLLGDETAPAGGYVITATGTAGISIVLDGGGFVVTAPLLAAGGGTNDAVFKVVGGDYITIENFVIQENPANSVLTPVTNNTMTEFGIALYGATTTDGAQNNTIQDNTITLNSAYQTSVGIISTCTFSSALTTANPLAVQTAVAGGENSNNKYYGNNISNVAFGIMVVAPPATSTFKETGDDIGGTSLTTGNIITYGNSTGTIAITYPSAQTTAAALGGITVTNAVGVNIRYNTVSTNSSLTVSTSGIILGFSGATPANSTFTNTISDNIIDISSSATAGNEYGIEFGYGNGTTSTATLTAANNNITLNQTSTAATGTAVTGIRTPYNSVAVNLTGNIITFNQTHAAAAGILSSTLTGLQVNNPSITITTATVTGNNITFNQSNTTTALATSSIVYGIFAGANSSVITTANINFNNITVKQSILTTGSYTGIITYIQLVGASATQATFPILNINSNNLNTLGGTIRTTGTVTGIDHNFTNVTTLSIASNIINFDRSGSGGTTYGTFSNSYPGTNTTTSTVSNNSVTVSGSMTSNPNITGFEEKEGNSTGTMARTMTSDTVIINLPSLSGGSQIGINFQLGSTALLTTTVSSISNCVLSITSAGVTTVGIQVQGTGIGGFVNVNANSFNLSSSNAIPTIIGVNSNGANRTRVFNNIFSSLAAPSATGNVVIRGILLGQGGSTAGNPNEVFSNTISNAFTFAGTGSSTVEGIGINPTVLFANIYKNKIYGLTSSTSGTAATALVTGIRVNTPSTAGGILNINNNYIGFDNSASPNTSIVDAVRGISFVTAANTATLNVFHNTIYLAATPSATVTNFGTTGIYHTTSATATIATLVLRNNIIVNNSTPKGTGRSVAFRRNNATLTNFGAASNNNLFYAGTPGASNLIFFDGTNSDQTLSAYQTRVGPTRDNASVSENPPFLSTLGSNANFLHINPVIGTVVESAGGTGTGITDDYDADTRCPGGGCPGGASKPDIGADELLGTCPTPTAPSTLVLTGSYTGNFTGAVPSPTGGYIVFRTSVNTQPVPVNGVTYTVGNTYTLPAVSAFVVSSSTSTTFANSPGPGTFYYWVFSFNTGCGTSPNYSTSAATSTTTPCVAPAQPTVLNLTSVSSSLITGSFTGSGASGYLVIRTITPALPTAPTNGTPYTAGQVIGAGTVVYSGTSTNFSATGLSGSTNYNFYVYAYSDGCFGTPTYNTVSPLNNNATTQPCLVPGTYTVGPTGNFTSIGNVMTALSCFTFAPAVPLTGSYIFEFQPAYNSSVETFPLVVIPVYNPTLYTITFRPQAGATGISITSANTVGTLLFQGIALGQAPNYYIFDGRPGGVGISKELTIQNTNIGSSYAIQFENGANNNTIQYCKIRSVHNGTSGGGGTINFASSNSTAGNSNNTITLNDIYEATGGTPTNAIFSNGLSTAPNNSNVISSNNIYNFFNAAYTTAGINLAANSNSWTISSNSFYQTAGRTFTSATANFNAILSAANTVGGLTIQDNFIGGTAPLAASGILSIGGNGVLRAIQLSTGTTPTSVQNNTIKSISFTSSNSSSAQSLISLVSGVIDVGTVTGNTLGAVTGANNITISLSDNTAGVNFAAISGSSTAATDVYQIKNNTIGSIGILGTSTSAAIQGINFSGATGTYTITGNTIGSTITANSFANSLNTTLTGILGNSSNTTVSQIISGNTIANLSATNTGVNSYATGISVSNLGKYTIGDAVNLGNTIYDLSSAGTNSINYNATGIVNSATTAGQLIYGNTIYNVNSSSASGDVGVVGIYYSGATGAGNVIENNNIHSLNMATSVTNSIITGIQAQSGTASYNNNMIRLGITKAGASITTAFGIYGITENAGTNKFYNNSVYVGGSNVGAGSDSYAFYGNNTGQDIRNNIFWNARSNASASLPNHYALILTFNTGTIDYNDILATGTGSVLGYYNFAQHLTLADWKAAATPADANSYSSLPGFINPTAATPDLHVTSGVPTVVEGGGTGVGPTSDIDGQVRASYTPNDLGADAINASTIPVTMLDGSIVALTSPAAGFGCYTGTESISGTFKAVTAINFAVTPVTITITVTGPGSPPPYTATINTGSYAAGSNVPFTAVGTLNMLPAGTYDFTCTFSFASPGVDRDRTNDEYFTTRNSGALSVGTASSNPINFCGGSGTPTISLNSVGGGVIQWYQSAVNLPAGDPGWGASVGTNSTSYTPAAPISATRYYYAKVTCLATSIFSNVVTVNVDNPLLLSVSGNQNSCGPNSFTFTGSVNAGSVLRWYDAATGALAGTGSPFNTPLLSSTTTYNAKAESTSGVPAFATFGTGTSVNTTTGYPAPYTNWYGGTKHQMLILGTELAAAGVTSGNITSVTFTISSVGSSFTGSLTDFTIYMGSTASTALTSSFLPAATLVYGPVNQAIPSSGPVTHTFTVPFNWDGISNIIIQTSYSNGNLGGTTDNVQMFYTPTSFASTNYYRADNQTSATVLGAATGNGTSPTSPTVNRPNMILGYTAVCSSPASSVTATINPAPTPIDISVTTGSVSNSTLPDISICTDSAKLVVTGGTTTQNSSVTVSSGAISVPLPDYSGGPSNTARTLGVTLPNGATIDSIRVRLNITHTWDADLNINLQSPNGQVVNLVSRQGGSGDNFINSLISSNTLNGQLSSAAAPFTGLYRADLASTTTTTPATNTNTFSSLFVTGTGAPQTWTLNVHDMAGLDVGTLQDWSISIFYKEPIPVPYLWTSSTGLYTNSGLSSGYTNQNIGTVFAKPATTTTYTVTATLGSCSKTDTIRLTVNNTSTAATAVNVTPSSGCSGNPITLTQTGGTLGTGASWKWYSDATFTTLVGTSVAADASLTISPAGTTTYYLRSEGGSAPCAGNVPSASSVTYTVNAVNTWLGVNTDWNDAANWCPGIPTSATNVTIPTVGTGFYPNITASSSCNDITITGAGKVTIAATGTLNIAGSITNTGDSIDARVGTVNFNGASAQTLRANHFKFNTIANLTITNTNTVTGVTIDNTGLMLKVTGTAGFGAVNNAKLTTSDKLTLVSNASGTARIGDVTNNSTNTGNNVIGKVVVERYIPANRAWRLLTSPLKSSTLPVPNIFNQWQESAQSTVLGALADPNPGYGTHVSKGNPYIGTFDQNNTGNSSIFYLTPTGWGGSPTTTNGTVAGTNTGVITDHPAYMLFVRGNRSTNLSLGIGAPTSATVLRNTGNIYVTPNSASPEVINGSGASVVGPAVYYAFPNPYPSAISFERIFTDPANSGMPNIFYVWNANLTGSNGVGAWVTVTRTGAFTYSTSPNTPSLSTGEIQSGTAFLLNYPSGGATLRYREPFKVSNSNFSLLRPVPGNQIRTTLIAYNADGTTSVNDGALAIFNPLYSNAVDREDANKMSNFAENICIVKDGIDLTIEKRMSIKENDTIYFKISKMRSKNYSLSFDLEGIGCEQGLSPILEDLHLKTKTFLNIEGNTSYDFNVVLNTASADPNRFRIVFKKLINYTGINAGVADEDVVVNWNVSSEFGIDRYEIERSVNGTVFNAAGNKTSEGNADVAKIYSWLDTKPEAGTYYYRIKCIGKNGVIAFSDIAKVTVIKSAPAMFVFPNPVTSNIIKLQMNKMPGGVYEAVLMSGDGKVVNRSRINHIGGTATEVVVPKTVLPNGNYQLEVTGPDRKRTMLTIMVQK